MLRTYCKSLKYTLFFCHQFLIRISFEHHTSPVNFLPFHQYPFSICIASCLRTAFNEYLKSLPTVFYVKRYVKIGGFLKGIHLIQPIVHEFNSSYTIQAVNNSITDTIYCPGTTYPNRSVYNIYNESSKY